MKFEKGRRWSENFGLFYQLDKVYDIYFGSKLSLAGALNISLKKFRPFLYYFKNSQLILLEHSAYSL